MGTDVYLEWTGKKEADEKKQAEACLTIAGGDVGYLRASIHMQNENAVLRLLFPDKYWHERSRDEYDFKANYEMLEHIGLKYILCSVTGKDLQVPEEQKPNMASLQQTGSAISRALKAVQQASNSSLGIYRGETHGLAGVVEWLNSLFQFFALGIAKQEGGVNPYPCISW